MSLLNASLDAPKQIVKALHQLFEKEGLKQAAGRLKDFEQASGEGSVLGCINEEKRVNQVQLDEISLIMHSGI